jgi:hypothetical protein
MPNNRHVHIRVLNIENLNSVDSLETYRCRATKPRAIAIPASVRASVRSMLANRRDIEWGNSTKKQGNFYAYHLTAHEAP